MNRFALVVLSIVAMLGAMAVPASATQVQWDLTGTYTIHYTCLTGCGGVWNHTDTIVMDTFAEPGTFHGSGYTVGMPGYTEAILNGTLTGSSIGFYVDYTGSNGSYYLNVTGSIASDGTLSGEASNPSQTFSWVASPGKARPFGYTESCTAPAFFVSATSPTGVSKTTIPRHAYTVDVAGTYYAGGNGLYDIRADAEFSQDRAQFAAGTPWTALVHNYESGAGTGLLDLSIDGANVDWGAFDAGHQYSHSFIAGDSQVSIGLRVDDMVNDVTSAYYNNTGGLCVTLTDNGYAGTFGGFFAPIDMTLKNVAKAGQTIPIKWRLLDKDGYPVTDLVYGEAPAGNVQVTSLGGTCSGDPTDPIEIYAGDSGLQYLGDGYWQFNWKTPKAYAGHCRTMTLTVWGTEWISAEFMFK